MQCAPLAHSAEEVDFNRDIRPLLSNRCFLCHGPDKQEGDFRLDVRESAVGAVITPGKAEASELIARVISDDPDTAMPPAESSKPRLNEQEVALLRRWIDQGAKYESHWAFIPPTRPTLPTVEDPATTHPIDRFVQAKLADTNLAPAEPADRRTQLRRVTLDLTGLPPTPEALRTFLSDNSPEAYEHAVDRLLTSPAFGEHQARRWLDIARYADTNGYQYDTDRQQWVWRDWVINAFNTNMPFDQFTIEQMAGDLLPNATDQTRLATAFHRNHPITIEGGVIDEEYRTEYVMDRVVTTSTTWLGLTFLCARCHDHKYDPVSQKDFYSFYSFFNNVPERGHNGFAPQAKIASPLTDRSQDEQWAELQKRFDALVKKHDRSLATWEQSLLKQQDPWATIDPTKVISTGGATLTRQDDGSYLASGKNPATDVYELTFTVGDTAVRALRLEALTDKSLVSNSVGRGFNGNFVLAEVEVNAGAQADAMKRIPITSATADYQQKSYGAANVIDGKYGRGGWAVDGNTRFAPSTLVLTLAEAIPAGSTVRVRLVHTWGGSHTIGRFRLGATGPDPPLTSEHAAILATDAAKRSPAQKQELQRMLLRRFAGQEANDFLTEYDQALIAQRAATVAPPNTMILAEMPTPRPAFVLHRGEYDKPRKEEPVSPAVPLALGVLPEDLPKNRLGLAKWLTSPTNPLTARVTVNRYWAQLFGIGLVETVEDFGAQGEYPSHPRLLDWLAVEFVESGWDVKHLFKTIVMSRTYRQTSHVSAEQHANDPNNRLLARGPRFRLDAEAIRDSALLASGRLDGAIGGPSVFPYHPQGLWLEINNRPNYSRAYPHQQQPAHLFRRSMYTYWKRTVPPPSMATFDAPEREFCVARRSRTNTPLQAFVMLHDPQFVEAARGLATRMLHHKGSIEQQLAFGFEICTARQPNEAELAVLNSTYTERLAQYRSDPKAAEKVLAIGKAPRDKSIDVAEFAAMTTAARLLLNLSEFLTKG